MSIIVPTVGRKVWYRPVGQHATLLAVFDDKQPCDATIVYVWNERMVNLVVHGPTGVRQSFNSVPLLQDDDTPPAGLISGGYAEWMPYQKTATLEPKAVDANGQAI